MLRTTRKTAAALIAGAVFSLGLAGSALAQAPAAPDQVETPLMPHQFGPVIARGSGPLDQQPRLVSRTHPPAWEEWIAASGERLPPAPAVREFDHMFYMLEAAASSLGAAIGSWPLVAQDIERGRLSAPAGFIPGPGRIALFAPKADPHPGVAPLRAWLLEEAAAMPRPVSNPHIA